MPLEVAASGQPLTTAITEASAFFHQNPLPAGVGLAEAAAEEGRAPGEQCSLVATVFISSARVKNSHQPEAFPLVPEEVFLPCGEVLLSGAVRKAGLPTLYGNWCVIIRCRAPQIYPVIKYKRITYAFCYETHH